MQKILNLDLVIRMYNLLEYSDNYSLTSGNLWNYYEDQINDNAIENNALNNINNKKITCKYLSNF